MFGFGKRTNERDQELPPAPPPCTPTRRPTVWHYEEMTSRWRGVSQALFASDAENKALRAEIERVRSGDSGKGSQAVHVDVLRGQLEHIDRLVSTLERELDTERTEKAELEQQIDELERDAYEYRMEIQRLRDALAIVPLQKAHPVQAPVQLPATWRDDLDRFEFLEVKP